MKDINLDGLDNVKADKELIDKTINKVMNNNKSKNYFNMKKYAAVAASLMVIGGSVSFYSLYSRGDSGKKTANKIVADSKITSNKTVIDDKINPDKAVVGNSDETFDKVVSDTQKTSKTVMVDGKDTSDKAVTDSKDTTGKTVVGGKITTDKAVVDDKSATGKTVVDGKVATNKSVEDSKVAPEKAVADSNVITIPAIILNTTNGVHAKMFALVVYKGKIYVESNTQLDSKNIKNFLGEKIGRTINSINEWNVVAKSSEELASNIGEQDIYTVKGYDNDFRIMSYFKQEDQEYAQFFDCLNGITIKSGKDIFGKLNLVGNIESAKYITFDDWNNGVNNYINFENIDLLNEVSSDLNNAVPYKYETVEKDIEGARNSSEFREFTLKLKDGSQLKFTAFKNGYVSYGYSNIYFKVESSVIDKLW